MKGSDYRRLVALLLDDWRSALAAFSGSPENVRVYALAVTFHPEHVPLLLCLNTERGFEQLTTSYPDASATELRRFGGARWNPGDFQHIDIAPASPATSHLNEKLIQHAEQCSEEQLEAHASRLADALVTAVQELSSACNMLDRTPDFIAYVSPTDAGESDMIELMRRTVSPPRFEQLFPEVLATERLVADLAQRPKPEQASFWAGALCDLVLETPSPSAQVLRALGRSEFDASDALVALGSAATTDLVRIAEEHALAEEFNARDCEEWKRHGAFTRRARLASAALLALEAIGDGPDEAIERLQALLQRVYDRDRGRELAGSNGQLTARALHALRPRRFPDARFSGKTNHLLNATLFGVREEPG